MNQYRCETCNYYDDDDNKAACNIREEWISTDVWSWIEVVGCASHSDFHPYNPQFTQNELEDLFIIVDANIDRHGKTTKTMKLLNKIEELRTGGQNDDGKMS